MRILFVMDPIATINPKKDSTLAMMWAAKKQSFELFYCTPEQLYLENGIASGDVFACDVFTDLNDFYRLGEQNTQALGSFDVIMMRKDPPFNMRFVYALHLLAQAQRDGAWVVNDPNSVLACNEKLFATQFPELMVPTLVTSQASKLKAFIAKHQDVIVKPLDGMGGSGIFRLQQKSANISATLEMLTQQGTLPIMAQCYIPDIRDGDKRILIINGEPAPYCLARIPASGETRGNLAAGGKGVAQPLSDTDKAIVAKIAPTLKEKGLVFVGLDVIGEYITEINVTSPTCIREIDDAYQTDIAGDLIRVLVNGLHAKKCG